MLSGLRESVTVESLFLEARRLYSEGASGRHSCPPATRPSHLRLRHALPVHNFSELVARCASFEPARELLILNALNFGLHQDSMLCHCQSIQLLLMYL